MRLIHWPKNKLSPAGGPSGYLYNLNQGIQTLGLRGYEFLPAAPTAITSNKFLQKIVPARVKDARRVRNLLALPGMMAEPVVDYSSYEAIHFHSTEDLYLHRNALKSYTGRVVLTSHSPLVYHKELIDRLNPKDAKTYEEDLKNLAVIDEYAFERADSVIFPCPEAEEPYFHTWEKYQDLRDEHKMHYVPTGIAPVRARTGRKELRAHYGIPEEAFVVTYIGRHNTIKGYDVLQRVASELLTDEDVWFLVAGKEGPLFGLDHPRWVEVGWTNDPYSVIAAADVFVLPNCETYFDLVLLEALSLGQVVVASHTGGNIFFEKFGCPGIQLYDTPEGMVELVRRVQSANEDERTAWRVECKSLYEREFTVETFTQSYDTAMNEICE